LAQRRRIFHKEAWKFCRCTFWGLDTHAIYQNLSLPASIKRIDWSKIFLFWSDERPVPPEHPESNFFMAMQAGLAKLPIPSSQIFRMHAENEIEKRAREYEKTIQRVLNGRPFDLMMLGMGEDGHTASLFPDTKGLDAKDQLIIANFVPQKKSWRMTVTFKCINNAEKYRSLYFERTRDA
jgi:6-phosphogluconolactonase